MLHSVIIAYRFCLGSSGRRIPPQLFGISQYACHPRLTYAQDRNPHSSSRPSVVEQEELARRDRPGRLHTRAGRGGQESVPGLRAGRRPCLSCSSSNKPMLLWSDPSEAPLLQGSRVGSSGSAPREDPDAMGFDQAHVAYDALAADNGANGNVLPSAVDRSMLQSR
mmetsp:Transcript_2561/g.7050  ORF Transcript_2561/g.7050 Transcript_2561/m.7050 type:complete len:166 (+) Transcript_2561:525-1022(+)